MNIVKRQPTQPQGNNQGTGVPKLSMVKDGMANTSGPSPAPDIFRGDNGAVGANAAMSSTANSGTTLGNALNQLYNTEDRDQLAYGRVLNPTLSGGQFPPGAPVVSGSTDLIGPSLQNSNGQASADAVQRLNYINGLPWNMPASIAGASINGPQQILGSTPDQTGLGASLQGVYSPPGVRNARASNKLNQQPQPPLNLSLTFPQSNLGGGLR